MYKQVTCDNLLSGVNTGDQAMEFKYITSTGIALDDSGHELRDENGEIIIVPEDERANYDIAYRSDGSEQKPVSCPLW